MRYRRNEFALAAPLQSASHSSLQFAAALTFSERSVASLISADSPGYKALLSTHATSLRSHAFLPNSSAFLSKPSRPSASVTAMLLHPLFLGTQQDQAVSCRNRRLITNGSCSLSYRFLAAGRVSVLGA